MNTGLMPEEIIKNSAFEQIFVPKTALICELIKKHPSALIKWPDSFGKTTLLDSLAALKANESISRPDQRTADCVVY